MLHDKTVALVMHQVHSSVFTAGFTLHTHTVPLCYITDISIQCNFLIFLVYVVSMRLVIAIFDYDIIVKYIVHFSVYSAVFILHTHNTTALHTVTLG